MRGPALTEFNPAMIERVLATRGVIFDMDGTLVLGDARSGGHKPLPGAIELLQLLRRREIPFRIFTNGTFKTPQTYAASLRHAGLDVSDGEMMTPSTSAAAWFKKRGIRRIRVLGGAGVQGPLREQGLDVVGPSEKADGIEAVYTGWFREFTFPDLEAACHDVWAGALLTTASNVPFFATQGGKAIGTSFVINAMIRSLTGNKARVLGKPSREAMSCALGQMGIPASAAGHAIVVGDDPALEMRMARSTGALAIAVTTGLGDRGSFGNAVAAERPDIILDGLLPMIEVLR
jgi:HAD superfamily hydrolase (TIGR01450 family)